MQMSLGCLCGVYSNPHIFWGYYLQDAFDFAIMKSGHKLISEASCWHEVGHLWFETAEISGFGTEK